MPEEKEVMTAEELAEYLSFSKNWVYRKAEAGEIPGVKLANRWRFKKSVIDRWLEGMIEGRKVPSEEEFLEEESPEEESQEAVSEE